MIVIAKIFLIVIPESNTKADSLTGWNFETSICQSTINKAQKRITMWAGNDSIPFQLETLVPLEPITIPDSPKPCSFILSQAPLQSFSLWPWVHE